MPKSIEEIKQTIFDNVISDIERYYKVSDRLYDIISDSLSKHLEALGEAEIKK